MKIYKIQINDYKLSNHKNIYLTHTNFECDFDKLTHELTKKHSEKCTNSHTQNVTYVTSLVIKTLKSEYGFNSIDDIAISTIIDHI